MADLTRWRNIISKASCEARLSGSTEQYVRSTAAQCARFSKLAADPATVFVVSEVTVHGRRVKGICMRAKGRLILMPISAFEGRAASHRSRVLGAMRTIISSQIENYRATRRQTIAVDFSCPLSGVDLRVCTTHVDHKIPFIQLATTWAEEQSIDFSGVKLAGRGQTLRFADEKLNRSWQQYHQLHAELQLVEAKANLRKGDR